MNANEYKFTLEPIANLADEYDIKQYMYLKLPDFDAIGTDNNRFEDYIFGMSQAGKIDVELDYKVELYKDAYSGVIRPPIPLQSGPPVPG